MNNSLKALAFGLGTVGIWSTVASAFKLTLNQLDPLQLLLCACVASIIALSGVMIYQKKFRLLKSLTRKDILYSALLGVLNPFLYYVVLFKAYDLLPAQEAQPLNYTWAITLSLLSVPLLKQKLAIKDLIAILISYSGVVIISTQGRLFSLQFSSVAGVTLALASTIIWALYWIYNTRSTIDPTVGLFLNFAFALPLILGTTILFSKIPTLSPPAFWGATYVGFFEMGITFTLWLTAMKYAAKPDGGGTVRLANLIFLSPFLSLVFIHFFVGETIHSATIIGLIFIVSGNMVMQFSPQKQ